MDGSFQIGQEYLGMLHDVGLIVFPWYPSLKTGRGHDTFAYHLLNNLSESNLDVNTFPVSTKRLEQGVNKLGYFTKEALLFSKVVNSKNRIYHGISPLGAKTAVLARKRSLITTIHDAIPFIHREVTTGGHQLWQAYERMCIKLSCEKSDRVIVTSDFTKNYLKKEIHFDSSKATVIKYGVDHSYFFCKKSPQKKGKMIFSIVRWGNLEQFLGAFKSVAKYVEDIKLLLGVKNSFESDFQARIPYMLKKMGLEKSVQVLDDIPLNKLMSYYNAADVYISASLGGFSLTLLESMACGTPVIAFDVLDTPDYVGKTDGVLVKPNDFQGIVDQTVRLLLDENLRNKLSKRSIEKSFEYSWEKMALETVEVYKELISRK
jgi:glycosyltransferase involved in cell wall biosynthesis